MLRHELKYLINEGEYAVLRNRLGLLMPLDRNVDQSGSYEIRSLYFDDSRRSALFDKIDGHAVRHKYRIRIYNYSDKQIKLERKSKYIQYTHKSSARLSRAMCDALLRGDYTPFATSSDTLLQEFYAQIRTQGLKPVVLVDYVREPYIYPAGNVRITFDHNIHTGNYSTDLFYPQMSPISVLTPGTLVMEVKYDHFLPDHIANLLQGARASRMAISKYALCCQYH